MSLVGRQGGSNGFKKPGTSNQTGNRAPAYPWVRLSVGRVAKVGALLVSYHLGADDQSMAFRRNIPKQEDLFPIFTHLFPWFEQHYNDTRAAAALHRNYTGPLEPFGPEDVRNRVIYQFTEPGKKGEDTVERKYGISVEHPSHPNQSKKIRVVYERVSVVILDRLTRRLQVSFDEADVWGQLEDPATSEEVQAQLFAD